MHVLEIKNLMSYKRNIKFKMIHLRCIMYILDNMLIAKENKLKRTNLVLINITLVLYRHLKTKKYYHET